jgi:hypothetical protein
VKVLKELELVIVRTQKIGHYLDFLIIFQAVTGTACRAWIGRIEIQRKSEEDQNS